MDEEGISRQILKELAAIQELNMFPDADPVTTPGVSESKPVAKGSIADLLRSNPLLADEVEIMRQKAKDKMLAGVRDVDIRDVMNATLPTPLSPDHYEQNIAARLQIAVPEVRNRIRDAAKTHNIGKTELADILRGENAVLKRLGNEPLLFGRQSKRIMDLAVENGFGEQEAARFADRCHRLHYSYAEVLDLLKGGDKHRIAFVAKVLDVLRGGQDMASQIMEMPNDGAGIVSREQLQPYNEVQRYGIMETARDMGFTAMETAELVVRGEMLHYSANDLYQLLDRENKAANQLIMREANEKVQKEDKLHMQAVGIGIGAEDMIRPISDGSHAKGIM